MKLIPIEDGPQLIPWEETPEGKAEAAKRPGPSVGDVAKSALSGLVSDTARGLGYGLETVGVDYGKRMRESADWLDRELQASMTPGGQAASEEPIFTGEGISDIGVSPGWKGAAVMQAARSIPQMAMMALPGGVATKALTKVIPAAAEGATGVGAFLSRKAPSALGYGGAEGVQAGLTNAAQTLSQIEGMPFEELEAKSPEYRTLRESGQEPEVARRMVAQNAAKDVAMRTTVSTGGIGALTGGGALGMLERGAEKSALKKVLGGFATEAIQETPQSAGEQYIQQLALKEHADETANPMSQVLQQGLGGGVVGGMTGAVAGGAGVFRRTKAPTQEILDRNPDPRKAAEELLQKAAEDVIRGTDTLSQPETPNDQPQLNPVPSEQATPETTAEAQTEKVIPELGAIAPKTVAGDPVESKTDEQLQALAAAPETPANTRHAAVAALQSREPAAPVDAASTPPQVSPEPIQNLANLEQAPTNITPVSVQEPVLPETFSAKYAENGDTLRVREGIPGAGTGTVELLDRHGEGAQAFVRLPNGAEVSANLGNYELVASPERAAQIRAKFPQDFSAPAKTAQPAEIQPAPTASPSPAVPKPQPEAAPPVEPVKEPTGPVKTPDHIANAGKMVERFTGQYKKGMGKTVAQQQQKRLAKERPNLDWKIEPAPEFGDQRFQVVGYGVEKATNVAEKATNKESLPVDETTASDLRRFAGEAGWAERGGKLIRSGEGASKDEIAAGRQGEAGEVIGRTKWIPKQEWFQRMRQDLGNKGLSDQNEIESAADKYLAGGKLTPKAQRTIDWMLAEIKAEREFYAKEHGLEDDLKNDITPEDVAEAGLEISGQEEAIADLMATAVKIDEAATERAAMQFEGDDNGLVAELKRIINDQKPKEARPGAKDSAKTPAAEAKPAEVAQAGVVQPRGTRMYHISPQANRDTIVKEGLRKGSMGWVWLSPSLEDSKSAAERLGNQDIWEIDVSGLTVGEDPLHRGFEGSRATLGAIPASRIMLLQEAPALELAAPTPEELAAREAALKATQEKANRQAGAAEGAAKRAANKAEFDRRAEQIRKERADAAVKDFALGQEAPPAEVSTTEAAGQKDILDQPARDLSPADLLRAAADKMDSEAAAKPSESSESAAPAPESAAKRSETTTAPILSGKEGGIADKNGPLFSRAASSPIFYSALARGLESANMKAGPPAAWRDYIKGLVNKGTVKQDEVEWTGINDWLATQTGKVTKEQVSAFMEQGGVKVTETVMGGTRAPLDVRKNPTGYEVYDLDTGETVGEFPTREAALQAAEASDAKIADTKFSNYQLPGSVPGSYRELVLTLPDQDKRLPASEATEFVLEDMVPQSVVDREQGMFTSSHFPDAGNYLAHTRVNDRILPDGRRILFVEEVQSDRAQKGRQEGFQYPEATESEIRALLDAEGYDVNYNGVNWVVFSKNKAMPVPNKLAGGTASTNQFAPNLAQVAQMVLGRRDLRPSLNAVPVAPFVTKTDNWTALVLKRLLRYGAEGEYDAIAWTRGDQQVERYTQALRKAVDVIEWKKTPEGVQIVGYKGGMTRPEFRVPGDILEEAQGAIRRNDNLGFDSIGEALQAIREHADWRDRWGDVRSDRDLDALHNYKAAWLEGGTQRTKVVDTTEQESALSDAIGKSMADKIRNDPNQAGTIEGEGITVSDTGMAGFYDRIVPKVAQEVAKKVGGGKVVEMTIPDVYDVRASNKGDWYVVNDAIESADMAQRGVAGPFKTEALARAALGKFGSKQQAIEITPAMREKIMGGLPLFAQGKPDGITEPTLRAEISKAFGPRAEKMVGDILIPLKTQADIAGVSELSDVVPLIREGDIVAGFYHPKTGKTYIVLENMRADGVRGTVMHEIGVHFGLEGMLGEARYAQLLKQVEAMYKAKNLSVVDARRFAQKQAARPDQVQEETVAYLITNRPELPFVQRIISQIKAFLFRKFGILGDRLTPDDIATLAKASVLHTSEGVRGGEAQFMVAWHGSPHEFEEFSLHKIGTGEGAAAYGWGLYFAGNREVAEYYRKALSGRNSFNGMSATKGDEGLRGHDILRAYYKPGAVRQTSGGLFDQVISYDEENGTVTVKRFTDAALKKPDMGNTRPVTYGTQFGWTQSDQQRVIQALEKEGWEFKRGRIYQVDLSPQEDEYLDWDKPLSEQSEKVRKALTSIGVDPDGGKGTPKQLYENARRYFASAQFPRDAREDIGIRQKLKEAHAAFEKGPNEYASTIRSMEDGYVKSKLMGKYRTSGDQVGGEFYNDFAMERYREAGAGFPVRAEAASKALAAAGIPGIRYLDGSSRGKGEGNSNYVIFDDKLVKVQAKFQRTNEQEGAPYNAALTSARNVLNDVFTSDRTLNRVISKFNTPFHIAETRPAFKPVYDEAQAFTQGVSRFANEGADLAPDLLPRIESFSDFKKTTPSTEDVTRTADALYAGTLWGGGSPMDGRIWTDEELKSGRAQDGEVSLPVFKPLNDGQIKLYRQAIESVAHSLEQGSKSLVWRLARQKKISLNPESSLDVMAGVAQDSADNAIEELRVRLDATDITEEATGRLEKQIVELEAFKKSVADIEKKTNGLIEHGYFPAMRFGEYAVNVQTFNPDGTWNEEYFGRFETQTAANIAKRELAKEFPDSQITSGVMNAEAHKLFQGLNLDSLELFAEHMTDENGNKVSADPVMQEFFRVAAAERSSLKRQIHRKGTPGFSRDISRVLAQFTVSNATSTSRNYHGATMLEYVKNIGKGDLQAYATRYVRYLQDPQEENAMMRGFLANYYILGSIAFGAVNMTQPILMTAPYLSAHTSWANAMKQLGIAAKDLVTGRKGLSEDEKKAYARAVDEGTVSPQEIHQIRAESRASMLGDSPLWDKLQSIAETKGIKLPGKLLMRKAAFLWGSVYALTEQFNRGTTFLAAYRIGKANGVDAYAFAKNAVDATQGVYARSNRPEVSRGNIGSTVMTFKQFSISYVELAKRLYDAKGPDGKPNRKAFAILMLTLFALAGSEGLPFAEDIEDLIDTIGQWMGYATNVKKSLRKRATDILGKDIADVLMHGFSAIPGVPIDVSNRLGMHNLIPGSAILKTSEDDKTRDIVNLLGPAASLFQGVGRAVEGLATGKPGDTKALLPLALQNVAKGAQMFETGQYRDLKGRKVMDIDSLDAFSKIIGFQPAKVAQESRIFGHNQQDIALQKVMESSIADRWAYGVANKEPDQVTQARQQLREWNERNPGMRIVIKPPQIARRIKELRSSREQRFLRSVPKEIRSEIRKDTL